MTTTTKTGQNGTAQQLAAKAPWTDEQGIAVKVYDGVVLAGEILMLFIKMTITWIISLYQFFIPPEPKSVKGEIILITGAGHGMGREMSLRFAGLGATVLCVDINETGNLETVNTITQNQGKAHNYLCDVTDRSAVMAMAAKIRSEVGEVTMLVNNAGIMPCKPLEQHTERDVRMVMDVNVNAHLWLLQAFLPSMKEKNHGHVVAMSSMAGVVGLRNLIPYCGSKFAVRGIMEALHEELREDPVDYSGVRQATSAPDIKERIKITVICPYIVDTGLCKNPKIKFPSLMKIVRPGEAADQIVDAVRRNYLEITIPSNLYYVNQYCRILPKTVPLHLKDFLDSGLDAQE